MTVLWIFIVVNVLSLVLTVYKMYLWFVLFPIDGSGPGAIFYGIIRIVFYFLESWTTLVFWFCFGCTSYWFIFFKMQDNVFTFMPERGDYVNQLMRFDIVFGIMMGLKLIVMLIKIFFQTTTDFFIMDREKRYEDTNDTTTPNAWR